MTYLWPFSRLLDPWKHHRCGRTLSFFWGLSLTLWNACFLSLHLQLLPLLCTRYSKYDLANVVDLVKLCGLLGDPGPCEVFWDGPGELTQTWGKRMNVHFSHYHECQWPLVSFSDEDWKEHIHPDHSSVPTARGCAICSSKYAISGPATMMRAVG